MKHLNKTRNKILTAVLFQTTRLALNNFESNGMVLLTPNGVLELKQALNSFERNGYDIRASS